MAALRGGDGGAGDVVAAGEVRLHAGAVDVSGPTPRAGGGNSGRVPSQTSQQTTRSGVPGDNFILEY